MKKKNERPRWVICTFCSSFAEELERHYRCSICNNQFVLDNEGNVIQADKINEEEE